tara:strand:- start:252 stop:602 length:351 start_codon:yes stop_codon:yes gene_type:complete
MSKYTGKYNNGNKTSFDSETKYKFNEDEVLLILKNHILGTYDQHYSMNKIQSTEFIFDAGHGEGFCIGNIIKYAQRYGKKEGRNKQDLLKILHYAVILLGSDSEGKETRELDGNEY